MPSLCIHTHCQVAQKSPPHEPKLVKEYGCPNADRKESTGIQQSV